MAHSTAATTLSGLGILCAACSGGDRLSTADSSMSRSLPSESSACATHVPSSATLQLEALRCSRWRCSSRVLPTGQLDAAGTWYVVRATLHAPSRRDPFRRVAGRYADVSRAMVASARSVGAKRFKCASMRARHSLCAVMRNFCSPVSSGAGGAAGAAAGAAERRAIGWPFSRRSETIGVAPDQLSGTGTETEMSLPPPDEAGTTAEKLLGAPFGPTFIAKDSLSPGCAPSGSVMSALIIFLTGGLVGAGLLMFGGVGCCCGGLSGGWAAWFVGISQAAPAAGAPATSGSTLHSGLTPAQTCETRGQV